MLSALKVSKSFGKMDVLSEIDFDFKEGEMHVIIGPNGAGKTTFVNIMTGVYSVDSGKIVLNDRNITKLPSHKRVRSGIGRTFQIPKPFMDLSVLQNVLVGSYFGSGKRSEEAVEVAMRNISFVGLKEKRDVIARELTSSQMKLLDLARALSGNPKFLFVDELAAGLSPSEIDDVAEKIKQINESGVCVIYIGHVMNLVKKLNGKVTALNNGVKIASGSYEEVANEPEVQKVYLGE